MASYLWLYYYGNTCTTNASHKRLEYEHFGATGNTERCQHTKQALLERFHLDNNEVCGADLHRYVKLSSPCEPAPHRGTSGTSWCHGTRVLVNTITGIVRAMARTRVYVRTYYNHVTTMLCHNVHVSVRTYYHVMSQLSDWKSAHMCTENHVCFGRIHGSQLREGAKAGGATLTYTLATALTPLCELQCHNGLILQYQWWCQYTYTIWYTCTMVHTRTHVLHVYYQRTYRVRLASIYSRSARLCMVVHYRTYYPSSRDPTHPLPPPIHQSVGSCWTNNASRRRCEMVAATAEDRLRGQVTPRARTLLASYQW